MRTRIQAVVLPSEAADFADELRRIFSEVGRVTGGGPIAGECSPPLDVYETDERVEITVDLPHVEAAAVRILARADAILIAGEKAPRRNQGDASFHLVERGYGRFARVVRLSGPCDTRRAAARFVDGELRISLPKITNRRGQMIPIAIAPESPVA
jgi:HSP20 family protein